MEIIFNIYNTNKKINSVLAIFSIYCLSLLLIKAKLFQSIYLFFLIWNLILAIIPYLITSYLSIKYRTNFSKIKTFTWLIIWLLFLPNSFYIITDIIHLSKSNPQTVWLDLVILISFSFIGFVFGIASLFDFEKIVNSILSPKLVRNLIAIICFLCGFGIYLGRILRFNSWEIISNPVDLIENILSTIISSEALLFSINFGIFIYIIYQIKKTIFNLKIN